MNDSQQSVCQSGKPKPDKLRREQEQQSAYCTELGVIV